VIFPALIFAASLVLSCGGEIPPGAVLEGVRPFAGDNIFLGKDEEGELIVEAHFRSQRLEKGKLLVDVMFLPTENFEFEEEYRGFAKVNYYKLRKKDELTLVSGDEVMVLRPKKSHTARSIEPFDITFERKKAYRFFPDTVDSISFPFKGVARWEKVAKEEAGKWRKTREGRREEARRRREALRRKRRLEREARKEADYSKYGGVWVSVNSTYLFEKMDVRSRILAKLPLGTFLEKARPAGEGWFEVIYGDPPVTGYVPSIMLSLSEEEALKWEEEMKVEPVHTPLEPDTSEAER